MSKIVFQPFIGKNYSNGGIFGKKILALGESHYCEDGEVCSDLTTKVVRNYLTASVSERWMNTFKKFERALAGKTTTPQDSAAIWESVAFYNYLQTPMGDNRIAGTHEDYQNAVEPFFEVLENLRPDVIIIWGQRLWNKTPSQNWTPEDPVVVDGYANKKGFYSLKNGQKILTVAVYHHPSTSFDWQYCHKVFKTMGVL